MLNNSYQVYTAIGTKCAAYACIFMDKVEIDFLESQKLKYIGFNILMTSYMDSWQTGTSVVFSRT